jgi:hypothetical protein
MAKHNLAERNAKLASAVQLGRILASRQDNLRKQALVDVGGAVGLMRELDPGERRRDAVLRSAGTGAATLAGAGIGGYGTSKALEALGTENDNVKALASVLGTLLGGYTGYQLGKREPREKKIKRILADLQRQRAVLGG